MNKFFAVFLAIVPILLLAGCREEKTYKIGVSQCSSDDWRTKMNDEINREILCHEDAKVEIRSGDDDNEKQIQDIEYYIKNNFDIIIVSPNEAEALTPTIRKAYDMGIPVIIFDRNIVGDSYTARIGADDIGLGRSAAHYALHEVGSGANALEIYGRAGSTPAKDRHTGFKEEFTKNGGRLLASAIADWNKEDAVPITDSLLRAHPETNLIFAHNDRMAIGAAEVTRRLGRDDIKIIGIDAAPSIGIQAVADSVIDATFLYPTEGHRIIRTALNILKGKPYDRETILPVSSAVDLSNADILLTQNETLKDETAKIVALKSRIDDYWARHSTQTSLFYACIAIILLLFGVGFLLLRAFWQHNRHQKELMARNKELEHQRDLEKSLNEQLQEATQSKLMFFTNVSHDLRTPLTLIAEPVEQVVKADNLTPEQQTMMKIADKNVKILRRLINQILDFRKYENGKLKLNLTEIDFNLAIHDWMESFYSLARRRDIKLTFNAPNEGRIPMAVDAEKMERVFYNIVSNAFKYTPDNGSITVSLYVTGDDMTFKVADTGEGISERDLGNIFNRFFQVDRVHPNGSGIGLSLAKAFVELHGGNISVESTLHKGSVFTVTIPIRHVAETVTAAPRHIETGEVEAELGKIDSEPSFSDDKPVVLIIDDNSDIRQMVGELLKDRYNIITAPNGREGVRMSVKYVPDLVICDVMMPVMDGLECCRTIKGEVSTSHIPVLMLTACSMDEQRVQGYVSGADGYLSKPFNSAVLRSQCESLIANRKHIRELWQETPLSQAQKPADEKERGDKRTAQLPKGDIDNEFYNRFLEIFEAEMGNSELNVDKVASRLGLERSQFYRKIKSLTNYSPVELMRTLRLKRGRSLLLATEKSISEIAYDIGFSTPAYFTKCYRDSFGETPTETRAKLGKDGAPAGE